MNKMTMALALLASQFYEPIIVGHTPRGTKVVGRTVVGEGENQRIYENCRATGGEPIIEMVPIWKNPADYIRKNIY